VTCNLGNLSSGAHLSTSITVLVSASFTGVLSNTAAVSATEPDPAPGNNSDTETTTVTTTIFNDGFESGDTSAWSSTTP
jgi:hypothetical protein